jgi:hypothetical protein
MKEFLMMEYQMDYRTSEMVEILGFKVTETRHLRNGQVIKNHYNIRNQNGEIVSRNYENFEEPVRLLHELANYLNATTRQNQY